MSLALVLSVLRPISQALEDPEVSEVRRAAPLERARQSDAAVQSVPRVA